MDTNETTTKRPIVTLIGQNGNAFFILAACRQAARKAGWSAAQIDAVLTEMQSGDYHQLLGAAMRHFDVR